MAVVEIKFGPMASTAEATTSSPVVEVSSATVTSSTIRAYTDIRSAFQSKIDNIVNGAEYESNPDGSWKERRKTISDNNRVCRKVCKDIESERKTAIKTINEIASRGKKDTKYSCSSANRGTRNGRLLG